MNELEIIRKYADTKERQQVFLKSIEYFDSSRTRVTLNSNGAIVIKLAKTTSSELNEVPEVNSSSSQHVTYKFGKEVETHIGDFIMEIIKNVFKEEQDKATKEYKTMLIDKL